MQYSDSDQAVPWEDHHFTDWHMKTEKSDSPLC